MMPVKAFLVVFLYNACIAEAFTSPHSPIHVGGRSIIITTTTTTRLFANEDNSNSCSRRRFVQTIAAASSASCCSLLNSPPSNAVGNHAQNSLSHRTNSDNNDRPIHKSPLIMPQSDSSTTTTTTTTSSVQESVSGFLSGAAVSAVKTVVKYPLDTAAVRLQMPAAAATTSYSMRNLPRLFEGSYDGILGPLISNVPAGAVFFAVKDVVKSSIRDNAGTALPRWVSTSVAVAAALPPYWLIRNPSEVVKTRIQAGSSGYGGKTMMEAVRYSFQEQDDGDEGKRYYPTATASLYKGYVENILYGFPADILKFVAYDSLSEGKKDLSPIKGAWYGALSTAMAQCVTTPLDVVRNRIMAEVEEPTDSNNDSSNTVNYTDRLVKIAREEGVGALFAGTTPRIAKAAVSGALQFAAYEETKRKVTKMFMRR